MDSPFDKMNDEDLLKFVREYGKEPGKQDEVVKPTEKLRFQVGGSVVEADTPEELQRLVQEKFEEAGRAARPVEQPQVPQSKPETFDMKKFTEVFVTDPDAGLDYLEQTKYGMSTRKAVPQLLAGVIALAAKVQELESASFAPKEDSERRAVEQIMKERQWAPSRQSFQDAHDIAKAKGLFGKKEETAVDPPRDERGRFIPPRVPRATVEDNLSSNLPEILRAAETMPPDKLEAFLLEAGVIKSRHFE